MALLTLGLLALDPYLAGHSGLLHTDGLLATFSLLALVSAVTALNEPFAAPWWALAGLFAGLTVLTKGPGLVVMAFVLAGVALGALRAAYRATTEAPQVSVGKARLYLAPLVRYLAISLPVCLGAIGLTTWTLYPALWGNPIEVIRTVATLASGIVESSMRTTFFIGHMTHDPGPLFYPVALLVRISPLVLIGLAVGIARWRHFPSGRRATILGILLRSGRMLSSAGARGWREAEQA